MTWDLEPRGGAVVVRMRSNSVNRMNPALFEDMHRAFDALDRDHPRAPVVLAGEGSTFSAGLDFNHVFPLFRSSISDSPRTMVLPRPVSYTCTMPPRP